MCLTAEPGMASWSPARSHTFVEIDHEIISTAKLLPPADSRRVVVSYKPKYAHEVLVNCLAKLAQEKKCGYVNLPFPDDHSCWLGRKVEWDVKNQTKQTKQDYLFQKKILQKHYQSVKWFESRSGPTDCLHRQTIKVAHSRE